MALYARFAFLSVAPSILLRHETAALQRRLIVYNEKYGITWQKHAWVKVHLVCDLKTNVVTGAAGGVTRGCPRRHHGLARHQVWQRPPEVSTSVRGGGERRW
jgi:hypothetical protein